MKFTKILLLAACIEIVISQQAYDCSKGCAFCTSQWGCTECYNTKLVPKMSLGRGDRLLQGSVKYDCAPQEPSTRCNNYFYAPDTGRVYCSGCKEGFIFNTDTKVCEDQPKFNNCFIAMKMAPGIAACLACNQSYPSKDNSQCLSFPSPATGIFVRCEIAAFAGIAPECIKCSPGYTVLRGYCVSTPSTLSGCLRLSDDGNECTRCNVIDGWYSAIAGSSICTKL